MACQDALARHSMLRKDMSDPRATSPSQALSPPGWARAADFAAILFAILALTIPVSGGVRALVWGWHLKIVSPFRLLLFAAAIVVARHVLVGQPSLFRSLREAIVTTVVLGLTSVAVADAKKPAKSGPAKTAPAKTEAKLDAKSAERPDSADVR